MPRGLHNLFRTRHRHCRPHYHFNHNHFRRRNYGRRYKSAAPVIAIPSSTPEYLIFQYDKKNKRFRTSDYTPALTQNRASLDEIEKFLSEVNNPIAVWEKKYRGVLEPSGKYICLFILFIFLFPFFCWFLWWFLSEQTEATKKLEEVKEKARTIVQDRGSSFAERGLTWNIPPHFPPWIELQTGVDIAPITPQITPNVEFASQNGIQMEMVVIQQPQLQGYVQQQPSHQMVSYQQNGYPMMQPNQQMMYNGNTYGGDVPQQQVKY